MYVYVKSEPGLWTVGHYTPDGKWVAESDHDSEQDAADRVNTLNGGTTAPVDKLVRLARLFNEWRLGNARLHDVDAAFDEVEQFVAANT